MQQFARVNLVCNADENALQSLTPLRWISCVLLLVVKAIRSAPVITLVSIQAWARFVVMTAVSAFMYYQRPASILTCSVGHCDAGHYCAQLCTGGIVCCIEGQLCDDVVSTFSTVIAGYLTVSKFTSSDPSQSITFSVSTFPMLISTGLTSPKSSSSASPAPNSNVTPTSQITTSTVSTTATSTSVECKTVDASTPNEQLCSLSCGPSYKFCGYYFTCFDPSLGQTCCPNQGRLTRQRLIMV